VSYGYRPKDFGMGPAPWDWKSWLAAALFAVLAFALAHSLFAGWPFMRFAAIAATVALFIRAFLYKPNVVSRWRGEPFKMRRPS
jgi:hypothetical protein